MQVLILLIGYMISSYCDDRKIITSVISTLQNPSSHNDLQVKAQKAAPVVPPTPAPTIAPEQCYNGTYRGSLNLAPKKTPPANGKTYCVIQFETDVKTMTVKAVHDSFQFTAQIDQQGRDIYPPNPKKFKYSCYFQVQRTICICETAKCNGNNSYDIYQSIADLKIIKVDDLKFQKAFDVWGKTLLNPMTTGKVQWEAVNAFLSASIPSLKCTSGSLDARGAITTGIQMSEDRPPICTVRFFPNGNCTEKPRNILGKGDKSYKEVDKIKPDQMICDYENGVPPKILCFCKAEECNSDPHVVYEALNDKYDELGKKNKTGNEEMLSQMILCTLTQYGVQRSEAEEEKANEEDDDGVAKYIARHKEDAEERRRLGQIVSLTVAWSFSFLIITVITTIIVLSFWQQKKKVIRNKKKPVTMSADAAMATTQTATNVSVMQTTTAATAAPTTTTMAVNDNAETVRQNTIFSV